MNFHFVIFIFDKHKERKKLQDRTKELAYLTISPWNIVVLIISAQNRIFREQESGDDSRRHAVAYKKT